MSSGLILAGRYQLQEQLGVGGMGSVWKAFDQNLGADVAVKLIDSSLTSSPDALERFRREARAAAKIRSTYVVQILDYGIDNDTPFIAMELLRGESLAHRLEGVQKLSPEETGHLLGHVGRALALAHEHGIVHRDLKPENIFLVREGREDVGKVLDFGIARHSSLAEPSTLKTQAGTILGTPYYMSPEQASGQPVDYQSDIWAFGIIAYECLVGRRAVDGDSLGAIFHAVCMAPLPVPSEVDAVPEGFDEWFQRAVARDKSIRFESIRQAAEELHTICGCTSSRTLVLNLTRSSGTQPTVTQPIGTSRGAVPQILGATTSPSDAAASPLIQRPSAEKLDIGSTATLAVSTSAQTIQEPLRPSNRKRVGVGLAIVFGCALLPLGWFSLRPSQGDSARTPLASAAVGASFQVKSAVRELAPRGEAAVTAPSLPQAPAEGNATATTTGPVTKSSGAQALREGAQTNGSPAVKSTPQVRPSASGRGAGSGKLAATGTSTARSKPASRVRNAAGF